MRHLLFICLIPFSGLCFAESVVPQSFEPARYTDSLGKSPFVLATKAVEVAAPKDSFTKDLYLRAVSTNQDGRYYILLQRLGEERAIHLEGSDPGEDGLMIKEVKVGGDFRQTKVTLQKGSETGEIGFKEDSITASPAPGPRPPGVGGGRPTGVPTPGSPIPNPGVRPSFMPPNRSGIPTPNLMPQPPTSPPTQPGDSSRRQRVRVINP